MYVRNAWYMAGWSHSFPQRQLTPITLLDEPVVFYRKGDGALVALEDRCVHRLAPLSHGCLEGDELRCMYHGLKYSVDGRCVDIPGHEGAIPDRARVKSYAVIERGGWVWFWPGEAAQADESLIPPVASIDSTEWHMKPAHMDYQAHYQLINDNLLDFSHLCYVHRASFQANKQWAQKRPKVSMLERGVRVQRWIEGATGFRSSVPTDEFSSYDFLVPGILLLGGNGYPCGSAAASGGEAPAGIEPIRDGQVRESFSCQAVTPLTHDTSRYFFCWGPRRGPQSEVQCDALMTTALKAFDEDRAMIEAQHKIIARSPGVAVMPTHADRAVLAYQRLVKEMVQRELDQEPKRRPAAGR